MDPEYLCVISLKSEGLIFGGLRYFPNREILSLHFKPFIRSHKWMGAGCDLCCARDTVWGACSRHLSHGHGGIRGIRNQQQHNSHVHLLKGYLCLRKADGKTTIAAETFPETSVQHMWLLRHQMYPLHH